MLSASQLAEFTITNPPKVGLSRKDNVQKRYDDFLKDPENSRRFIERMTDELKDKKYILLDNTFPYNVEEGIEHKVCWFKDCDMIKLINELKSKMDVITCWRNIPENCSIPAIKHLHVFVRL